jgi:hypothetical protein
VHYTGALTATVHVVCIFLFLFLFCCLCILFKFSFSDNLYILFCVIKNEKKKKKIMLVLGVAKYSSLLYYGYRCLMGFFILLFNDNFSECVLVCLNVFCY